MVVRRGAACVVLLLGLAACDEEEGSPDAAVGGPIDAQVVDRPDRGASVDAGADRGAGPAPDQGARPPLDLGADQDPPGPPDADGDGIGDDRDNCPDVANAEQADADADGRGDACDGDDDNDGVDDADDCAALDPAVGRCQLFNADRDGDGFGDGADSRCACGPGAVYTATNGLDCDDAAPDVHPGAEEICDGVDQRCAGRPDEGFPDADGDGRADCVDADRDGDGVPNEADTCPDVIDAGQADLDGDGAGDACDDDDDGDGVPDGADNCPRAANPDQADASGNGRGDVCDQDPDSDGVLEPLDNCPLAANPDQGDLDGDGEGDACDADIDGDGEANAPDCAPRDPAIHHGASERCDGRDNDCSGVADDALDAVGCAVWFRDADNDGFGALAEAGRCQCGAVGDFRVQVQGDCDDGQPGVNPNAEEVCNGVNDDCDGGVDEAWPELGQACDGPDADACADGAIVCAGGGRETICDDGPATPGAEERCNGADDDCDGRVDETWADALGQACDGDDADACPNGRVACAPDGQRTACAQDLPADLPELCDGEDNDCDGRVDEGFAGRAEQCDGEDQDCDGRLDEDAVGEGEPCRVPDAQGLCAAGVNRCLDPRFGARLDCRPLASPAAETCDGRDEDCDGAVDEDGPPPAPDAYEPNDLPPWFVGANTPSGGMRFRTGRSPEITAPAEPLNLGDEGVDCFDFNDSTAVFRPLFLCRVRAADPNARFRLQIGHAPDTMFWQVEEAQPNLASGAVVRLVVDFARLRAGARYGVCVTREAGLAACVADYSLECALSNDPDPWP